MGGPHLMTYLWGWRSRIRALEVPIQPLRLLSALHCIATSLSTQPASFHTPTPFQQCGFQVYSLKNVANLYRLLNSVSTTSQRAQSPTPTWPHFISSAACLGKAYYPVIESHRFESHVNHKFPTRKAWFKEQKRKHHSQKDGSPQTVSPSRDTYIFVGCVSGPPPSSAQKQGGPQEVLEI